MKITAPGKLMLSGEWSILEDGIPCIVMAINQKVSAEIIESEQITFNAPGFGISKVKAKFEKNLEIDSDDQTKQKLLFVGKAVETTLKYLKDLGIELKNFSIETRSEDTVVKLSNGKDVKVGFGSSAAIVVASIAGVLAFHGEEIASLDAKEKIFKLGCISHYYSQGKIGSSFDVASSTYGNVLLYQKPDMAWLVRELESEKPLKDIIEEKWPLFRAEPISLPKDFKLSIGFVGYSASTKELVIKMKDFKESDKDEFDHFMNSIKGVTLKLIDELKQENKEAIISLLKENRKLLKDFSERSKNNLETKELSKLSDLADEAGGVGKFSGAGGGDCGIGVSFDEDTKIKIENSWKENGLYLISADISKQGVSIS